MAVREIEERDAQLQALREKRELAEQKRAEAEAILAFYKASADAMPNPIFIKDDQLRFVFFNRAYREFFGLKDDAYIGKRVQCLEYLSEKATAGAGQKHEGSGTPDAGCQGRLQNRPYPHLPAIAIRYGGDEFMAILPGASLPQAQNGAERLPGEDLPSFISRADEALYLAKKSGGNRVAVKE